MFTNKRILIFLVQKGHFLTFFGSKRTLFYAFCVREFLCCSTRILVEFIVLEKWGSGDRFLVTFTVKKAIRGFAPCGPLNIMMYVVKKHQGMTDSIKKLVAVTFSGGGYRPQGFFYPLNLLHLAR